MICIKTGMKEMPKSCEECWILCDLVNENNNENDYETNGNYSNKRHEKCPLIEI